MYNGLVIMTYKEQIEELKLAHVEVSKVKDHTTFELITILGGFGEPNINWGTYLYQIQSIMELFSKDCWIVDLNNNPLEDKWTLRIGVRK